MKYNEEVYNLLRKHIRWAGVDWAILTIDNMKNEIFIYDIEEKRKQTTNWWFKLMFANGMLNECFTDDELKALKKYVPKDMKEEIDYYIKGEQKWQKLIMYLEWNF